MTLFDVVALVIILASGLVGFSRGAVKELVTVFAFTLASMAAVFLLPVAGPFMRDLMSPPWAANAAAAVIVFVIVYIGLRLAAHLITSRLHAQPTMGTIDRSIGLGFGVVRALVFLGLFYLVFNMATPPELMPRWMTGARLYPLARGSAQMLQVVAPRALAQRGGFGPMLDRVVKDETPAVDQPADGAAPRRFDPSAAQSRSGKPPRPAKGYDKRSRDDIDALVEKSR